MKQIKEYIPDSVNNNFFRIIVSLVFSALIIYFVRTELTKTQNISREFRDIKVQFQTPPDMTVVQGTETYVSLTVEGYEDRLKKINEDDIKIIKKITDQDLNLKEITLLKNDVSLPVFFFSNLHVVSINPKKIPVSVDKIGSKEVPITCVFNKDGLPEGFQLGNVTLDHNKVAVTGPAKLLDKIMEVKTEPIPLEGMTQSFTYDFQLVSQYDNNVSLASKQAKVTVEIVKKHSQEMKAFQAQVRVMQPNSQQQGFQYEITPETVTVYFTTEISENEALNSPDFYPCVDVKNLDENAGKTCKVGCWVNQKNIQIQKIEPETVTVTARKIIPEKPVTPPVQEK